jgi:hypothetical protein
MPTMSIYLYQCIMEGGIKKQGGDNKWRQIKEQENSVSRLMIDTSFGIDRQ